jgi:hypothetical protein
VLAVAAVSAFALIRAPKAAADEDAELVAAAGDQEPELVAVPAL